MLRLKKSYSLLLENQFTVSDSQGKVGHEAKLLIINLMNEKYWFHRGVYPFSKSTRDQFSLKQIEKLKISQDLSLFQ